MAVELGRVHALDLGDTRLVGAAMLHADRILKDIGALGQVVDEEMARRVGAEPVPGAPATCGN